MGSRRIHMALQSTGHASFHRGSCRGIRRAPARLAACTARAIQGGLMRSILLTGLVATLCLVACGSDETGDDGAGTGNSGNTSSSQSSSGGGGQSSGGNGGQTTGGNGGEASGGGGMGGAHGGAGGAAGG